jgi:hypothetical protein
MGGRRRLPVIALVMLALAGLSAVGVSAVAARDGAQPVARSSALPPGKKGIWGPLTLNGRSLFPTYRALRVGVYNTSAHWDQIAPTKPTNPTDPNDPAYQWPSYLDQSVAEAGANGIKVQILLIGTPPWANGGQSSIWPPTQPSDFADFATAIAKKYPSVNLWMIWGEPNRKPNFGPLVPVRSDKGPLNAAQQVAPRLYAELLDAAYGALKAVSPANLIIGGNTYTAAGKDDVNTYQWIQNLKLPNGSRPRLDLWGHNPYGFDIPNLKDPPSPRGTVTFSDLRRLVQALDKSFPGKRLKLYLAEWGVPIGFKDKDLLYRLKPKEGLSWIRAACRISRWGRIFLFGWVHPVDTPRSSQGLLTRSGAKKPSFNAFKKC